MPVPPDSALSDRSLRAAPGGLLSPPDVVRGDPWRFPRPHESVLGNGLRVLALDCPGQHVLSAWIVLDVPLDAEPRAVEGVAGLSAECLCRGAGDLSAEEFADALAAAGADIEAAAGRDVLSVRLAVPDTRAERGLELLGLVVGEPSLAEEEVLREQRLRLEEIEQSLAYPTVVAGERLNAEVFGPARFARPAGGTRESVSAVTREDVVRYAADWLDPRRAVLVLAGDSASRMPTEVLERTLGRWWAGGSAASPEWEAPLAAAPGPQVVLVHWPGAAQAVVRVAAPAITRTDERWPGLFVANYVVGGSFGSRLNTELRERRGLTYGIGSGLDSTRRVGVLGVGASVQADAAAECVGEIVSMVAAACEGGFTDAEVADAVQATTESAPLSYERADAVAGRAEVLLAHRLAFSHVDVNLARIREVTPATAHAALASVIDPSALTVVVAADAESQAEPLRSLGYGEVSVVVRPR